MYTLTLQGTTGPESDIAKARIYVNGTQKAEVDTTPGAQFTAQVTWPANGDVVVEYSFVDAAGNTVGAEFRVNTTTSGNQDDPAVTALISQAIKACLAQGKYIGICGQGPSDHPDFAQWLAKEGISSISLNPDSVVATWQQLAG